MELPPDAHGFHVHGRFMIDSGDLFYYFRTSEPEVRKFIQRLEMRKVPEAAIPGEGDFDYVLYLLARILPGAPDPHAWKVRHRYVAHQPKGVDITLVANAEMTEVFFLRQQVNEDPGPEVETSLKED